jgi:CubicO group peptidase (beta-lactamase class C family)
VTGCPWDFLVRVPSRFCEASLCGWVRQPANTWSNIGFFAAGFVILRMTGLRRSPHLRGLGYVCLATGCGSTFYHASESSAGRIADYAGMYLGGAYMLAVNLARWLGGKRALVRTLSSGLFGGAILGMLVNEKPATAVYTSIVLLAGTFELALFFAGHRPASYGFLARYWLVFGAAYGVWLLDRHRILCDPSNHLLNGHAAWHLLNGLGFYLLFRYYEQFAVLKDIFGARSR